MCGFADPPLRSCIAVLQRGKLETHAWQGEVNSTPVPVACTRMHALPQGLLLSVSPPRCQSLGSCHLYPGLRRVKG